MANAAVGGSPGGLVLLADEEEAAAGVAAARADDANFRGCCDLAVARLAPHLRRALVQEAVAMQAPGRQLPPVRVQGQLALTRDVLAAVDERAAAADLAQAQRLEPRHREPGEPVVQLRHLHV